MFMGFGQGCLSCLPVASTRLRVVSTRFYSFTIRFTSTCLRLFRLFKFQTSIKQMSNLETNIEFSDFLPSLCGARNKVKKKRENNYKSNCFIAFPRPEGKFWKANSELEELNCPWHFESFLRPLTLLLHTSKFRVKTVFFYQNDIHMFTNNIYKIKAIKNI